MTQADAPGPRAAVVVDAASSPHARLRPVPVEAVALLDAFWAPRLKVNRERTIPGQYRHCEETGRLDNFRRAAGHKDGPFQGIFFNDSDVYKWLEAAAWAQAGHENPRLAHVMDMVAGAIAAAQQPDGYLNTYFMFERAGERWTNLKDMHELYCAGHFLQAAVAHWRTTGDARLLEAGRRLADHIDAIFGPAAAGKREGACGHEEVEMALVELARATGERRYLELARFFVDVRGRGTVGGGDYHQDHAPVREQRDVRGHAVRAMYLYAGAADVVLETGDAKLREALGALWTSMAGRRQYVTGGLGARWDGEAFGADYELPDRAYAETCAGIGALMWAWRMLLLEGDARYADAIEWLLYNAILPGVSLAGDAYFYQNPLADDGRHRREPWFGCACCPPNLARLLASLPGYSLTVSEREIQVHQYATGAAQLDVPGTGRVVLAQYANYPWDALVRFVVEEGGGEFGLRLRIPGWCESGGTVEVNGEPAAEGEAGTTCEIRRVWAPADEVTLTLPMPPRRLEAHPRVAGARGRIALARGPVVYCLEACDHSGMDVRDVVLPREAPLHAQYRPDLLGGVTVLRGAGRAEPAEPGRPLYRTAGAAGAVPAGAPADLLAVPYFSWANREPGAMTVWIREA